MLVNPLPGISDQDYFTFCDADDQVLTPLDRAHRLVEDALTGIETYPVDSLRQIEYARTQIESMRYLLGRILTEHLEAQ